MRRHPAVREHRSGGAGRVPGRDPQRLHRRADPRRAERRAPSGSAARRRCASSRRPEQTTVHPQTVIEHFGTWNAAKRQAGLVPRRFATREELLGLLRDARRGARPHADGQGPRGAQAARCRRSRSTGTRSARSPTRCARPASTCRGRGAARARGRPGRAAGADARPAAEVRRLGRGAQAPTVAADRVAGLPHVRRPARRVVDVPVPGPRAPARGGRRASRRTGRSRLRALRSCGGRDRGERA